MQRPGPRTGPAGPGVIFFLRQLNATTAPKPGKTDAILSLCDRFNAETDNGRNMARYDALLNAVIVHVAQMNRNVQAAGLGLGGSRDFTLPTAAESPAAADFELVTWLVIMGPGKAGEP